MEISNRRSQRETKDKESQRWLTALGASQVAIPEGVSTLTITDREGDIYDFLAAPRRPAACAPARPGIIMKVQLFGTLGGPGVSLAGGGGHGSPVDRELSHGPRRA